MFFWYIYDGNVEEYSGQEANWRNSAIVFAETPEDALVKVIKYNRGTLKCQVVGFNGSKITAVL